MGFKAILADPPWQYSDQGSRIAPSHESSVNGYSTMPLEDIKAMPIATLAADDALLFLWATSSFLVDGSATEVARAWGFEPKTFLPWVKLSSTPGESKASYAGHPAVEWLTNHGVKINIGMGHYIRNCAEPLIICARGRATVPPADRLPGVLVAPRRVHSQKPLQVYDLVETLSDGPYLELFARAVDPREGWSYVGDQKDKHEDPTQAQNAAK
jgi:N6-adenosine-specific RNA methylase IME4